MDTAQLKKLLKPNLQNGLAFVKLSDKRYVNQLVKQGVITAKQISRRYLDNDNNLIQVEHLYEIRLKESRTPHSIA